MTVPDILLGLMSGTSLDGVDCVLTRCRGSAKPVYVRHWTRRFPAVLRRRLMAVAAGGACSWECGQLHHDLGRFYAAAAMSGLGGERLKAVGLHGQTVFHRPDPAAPATWQLGEPAYLAEALRVPVVANFRAADLAAGGQGAPLATLFHVRMFARRGRHVCVNNLGGISNVTSIDWRRGAVAEVRSFDTGPANMLLDLAMARLSGGRLRMDRGGRRSAAGVSAMPLVRAWLEHPFLRRPPPKSTGREEFGDPCLDRFWAAMEAAPVPMSAADRLATLAEFTARSIAFNYSRHLRAPPDQVILCGGGVHNRHLVARLEAALREESPGLRVEDCGAFGWPVEAVEGGAFALLAHERLRGRPGNLPATTGARNAVLCGQVADGTYRG